VLLAGNLWLYWDFLAGRGEVDARRREVGEAIAVEEHRKGALEEELTSYHLAAQNEQVRYLNQRIEQRRFSWSRLFDELSDLLPRDVRLVSLTPSAGDDRSSGRARASASRSPSAVSGGQVLLQIEGQARSDQAILDLVDALFADPDFDRPNLRQQTQERDGLTRFSLDTDYRPRPSDQPEEPPAAPQADAPVEEATAGGSHAPPPSTRAPEERRPVVAPTALGRVASAPQELS
jgi:Tfp pilus assembly protein PilN